MLRVHRASVQAWRCMAAACIPSSSSGSHREAVLTPIHPAVHVAIYPRAAACVPYAMCHVPYAICHVPCAIWRAGWMSSSQGPATSTCTCCRRLSQQGSVWGAVRPRPPPKVRAGRQPLPQRPCAVPRGACRGGCMMMATRTAAACMQGSTLHAWSHCCIARTCARTCA